MCSVDSFIALTGCPPPLLFGDGMSFGIAVPPPSSVPICIAVAGWPSISLADARDALRIDGTVIDDRFSESLQNAAYAITAELFEWRKQQTESVFDDERLQFLFRRAVYYYAHAELLERYRNLDVAKNGEKHYESVAEAAGDSRRNSRWAIADILAKTRLTVWVL